jgi:hypothetical protein
MEQSERRTEVDFDPFAFAPFFGWARHVHTAWFGLLGVLIALTVVVVTWVEGTLGALNNFELREDVRRIVGLDTEPSAPSFPLLRDVASWFLLLVIVATCMIVHRQWQLMSDGVSELRLNNVLIPETSARPSRLPLLNRLLRGSDGQDQVMVLLKKINDFGQRIVARAALFVAGAAAILAFLLIQGEKSRGLFQVVMPRGLSPEGQASWLSAAYESWWASDSHPLGIITYFTLAVFGLYVILMQNVVGVVCAYLAVALSAVAKLDADWLNRDGRYGWRPVARIFRTVYLSLALHGLALSVLVVILGVQNFTWVSGLVLIWVVMVPLYILVPWLAFRSVEGTARRRRIDGLGAISPASAGTMDGVRQTHDLVAEIDRCRRAKIRPMGLGVPEFSTVIAFALLPAALTATQIFFSVRFGAA